jgi:hypothetical protein
LTDCTDKISSSLLLRKGPKAIVPVRNNFMLLQVGGHVRADTDVSRDTSRRWRVRSNPPRSSPPRIDRHPITEKDWREEINSLELTNLVD